MKIGNLKRLLESFSDDDEFMVYWHENEGRMELYVRPADEEKDSVPLVKALTPEEDFFAD